MYHNKGEGVKEASASCQNMYPNKGGGKGQGGKIGTRVIRLYYYDRMTEDGYLRKVVVYGGSQTQNVFLKGTERRVLTPQMLNRQ